MHLKIDEMCTSFPCREAASFGEKRAEGESQEDIRAWTAVSFSWGRLTILFSRSQSKPVKCCTDDRGLADGASMVEAASCSLKAGGGSEEKAVSTSVWGTEAIGGFGV